MRSLVTAAAVAAAVFATFAVSPTAHAQLGYRSYDPMGVDRPPGPVPNAKQGKRRVYKPVVGNYPRCEGLMWAGTRCRLPTGQVCTVYEHGLDNCI